MPGFVASKRESPSEIISPMVVHAMALRLLLLWSSKLKHVFLSIENTVLWEFNCYLFDYLHL